MNSRFLSRHRIDNNRAAKGAEFLKKLTIYKSFIRPHWIMVISFLFNYLMHDFSLNLNLLSIRPHS